MNKRLYLLFLLASSFFAGAFGQATIPCTYTDPNGDVYDLSPLANPSSDYTVDVPTGYDPFTVIGYRATINICRPLLSQACVNKAGPDCDACMEWPLEQPNQFAHSQSLGVTNSTFLRQGGDGSGDNGEGVTLTMGGGTWATTIYFVCDPSAEIGHPSYVTLPAPNSILFRWKSKYGCASQNPEIERSQVFCDCASADISLCMETGCPKDTTLFCKTECLRFGGLGTSEKNSCSEANC